MVLVLPGELKSGFVAVFIFFHREKKNKLFKSSLSVPRNNGITNTVSISLPGLFSLVFVEPEVIPHRLYSLLWEKISSSGSLRRLQKKWAFKTCMVCLNIFPIRLVSFAYVFVMDVIVKNEKDQNC